VTTTDPHPRVSLAALRNWTEPQWYSLLVGVFLLTRGVSTLAGGADFARPGDGWRAVLQLLVALVLLGCLTRRAGARVAVVAVGALYAAEAIIGNTDGHDILGVIPVDSRDKIVHPTLALLAIVVILLSVRRRRV
jgi:hypothetical protein